MKRHNVPKPLGCAGSQRVKELSAEVREFVAIQDAKVLPLSAHTGFGLDNLRTSLADALSQTFPAMECVHPTEADPEGFGLQPGQSETSPDFGIPRVDPDPAPPVGPAGSEVAAAAGVDRAEGGSAGEGEVVMAGAPEGAATGTVLDYTSSAKTGKVLVSWIFVVCVSWFPLLFWLLDACLKRIDRPLMPPIPFLFAFLGCLLVLHFCVASWYWWMEEFFDLVIPSSRGCCGASYAQSTTRRATSCSSMQVGARAPPWEHPLVPHPLLTRVSKPATLKLGMECFRPPGAPIAPRSVVRF